ncbi:MAG: class I SAM-dependent methyltransferase [Candidatus Nitrosotalea sp.]|nr:class I SAM-dependent methyltransferase [Candidatus Nitrosotalea sp.]
MNCRFCNSELTRKFVDLGMSPLANSYLRSDQINQMEPYYPLHAFVCNKCLLVQLEEFETPEHIFTNYAYFSSYSQTWVKHAEEYANTAINRFNLDKNSQVIEIASNDGYLLQNFQKRNIPILGIEPAANVAKVAKEKGIPTLIKFFGAETANKVSSEGKQADLLIVINVMPHVPNLIDFVKGMKIILKPGGIITIQFSAYLLQLIQQNEFDTVYHEHFSYFSLITIQKILSANGLEIFDVEELSIHGGSLRIYVKHMENNVLATSESVNQIIQKEKQFGLDNILTYEKFQEQVIKSKQKTWEFFIMAKNSNKKIVCYGAPAKGNTFLNYCGIGTDFIDYTVDINPHKQGLFLPGTHIPIKKPEDIQRTKPDYLLILAWNLKDEIMNQMGYIRDWGGKFVVLVPEVKIYT